ncbi:MAG TPA: hypothetical protein VGH22_21780 [Candidatus Binatia bacterium]|jgi:hypothetical protein
MKGVIGSTGGICLLIFVIGCAPGNLSTRQKRSGVGAPGGVTAGGAPGTAVGQSGAGLVIGESLGLATGVLVGDQLQGQESQPDQQPQIDGNKTESQRQHRDMEKLRRQGEY